MVLGSGFGIYKQNRPTKPESRLIRWRKHQRKICTNCSK